METLAILTPGMMLGILIFAALAFFIGFLGILMTIFGLMLKPIKKQLENHVTETKADIKEIKADIKRLLENKK